MYIDVRTKEEWDDGHINDAIHFDLSRLIKGELPNLPKDTEIKLYCHTGVRAGVAKAILEREGFTFVTNAGGFEDIHA
jgi:rhodanese-related sulfurtransferase